MLKGRYGYYAPRDADERRRDRKQAQQRREQAAAAADWVERTRMCINGCGAEAARWADSPAQVLKYGGACSPECESSARQEYEARAGLAAKLAAKGA